ncbi:unnamed protein product [Moneuplotes crassus]|uniref:FAD-binding FR-type domain-containing protein n=1 Tax=Euplotes crassus TaxID=5936 RepID=A0AAD1XBF9_EUPCR|nr:unnamed protein product [Moneuplotes crassus]
MEDFDENLEFDDSFNNLVIDNNKDNQDLFALNTLINDSIQKPNLKVKNTSDDSKLAPRGHSLLSHQAVPNISKGLPETREERKKSLDTIPIPKISRQRRPSRNDPDIYIKKAFGKNFEFSEQYLTSKISSNKICKAIKKRYGFEKVTRSTLKHILYEGARTNHILRMNNSCFDKMVDILNIDCDSDEESEKSPENKDEKPELLLKKSSSKLRSSQGRHSLDANSEDNKNDGIEEKKKTSGTKNSNLNFIQEEKSQIMDSSSNNFSRAVDLLQNIVNIEEENLDIFKPILVQNDPKVAPKPPATRHYLLYLKLKEQYHEIILKILEIRKGFTQKLIKDVLPTLTTQQDEISENEMEYELYTNTNGIVKPKCFDLRKDYIPKLIIITTASFGCAIIMGIIILFHDYFDQYGFLLLISKSCCAAIVFLMTLLLFFISHDLMTCIRRRCKNFISGWLDHYFMIHKFCGYLITIYGIIHSICHLAGSFRVISSANDMTEINRVTGGQDFDEAPAYWELLFCTLPGITGLILLFVICAMAITSTRCIRMNYFQIFGYTHMALFPIFLITLLIHGLDFWFTIVLPMALIMLTPGTIGIFIQQFMRVFSHKFNKFSIIDISVSSDCTYMLMYCEKPKNYRLVHGQYVFINCPVIHPLQWHPFTVASSPNNPHLILMIKKAGDWTGKLIRHLYECKKRMMKMHEFDLEENSEYDMFNLLHDLHQEISFKASKKRNKLFYPMIKISMACSTPNDTFITKKNVIMVGAGSGISPYLCLLEEVIHQEKLNVDKKKRRNADFDFDSAKLIFISRAGEQISWISNYLFHIINSPWMIPKLEFNIFLTLEKNLKTIPSFLFWRALVLISLSKNYEQQKSSILPQIRYNNNGIFVDKEEFHKSPVKIIFGRPNFEALFKSSITEEAKKIYVYSTSGAGVNQSLFDTCYKLTKDTGVKFQHIYEATS